MTNRSFYKHSETGIVALINDRFAALFNGVLIPVDGPEPEAEKPKRGRPKKVTEELEAPAIEPVEEIDTDDSSKEGND